MNTEKSGFTPHAVVIGSGFGGLAAAIRLLARGYAVTVVEALDGPGGRGYAFEQDGYRFDSGPTIITAPELFEELWALGGRRLRDDLDLRPLDPFYVVRFDDGDVFNARADLEATRREVARIAPDDMAGFDGFLADSKAIFDVAYTKLSAKPFHKFTTFLAALPAIIRLQGYRSVYSKAAQFFRNDKLRIAFSFHPMFVGGHPFTTTSYYGLISYLERLRGVHFAMGGTGAVVQGLASLIEGMGGTFRYNTSVEQITVEDGRATGVRLAGGERVAADIVVSNADSAFTYKNLLSETPRRWWSDMRLNLSSYSTGLFIWYFGTTRRYEDVPHHTIMMGPRYKGLLDDIFAGKILAEDFSLYLYRPTATDPSMAPPGCDSFYVLSPVPHLGGKVGWGEAETERYRAKIQRKLEETLLPGLGDAIATSRVVTPVHFRDRLNSVNGAGFSLAPKITQVAWFRPHNVSEDVRNLYLVGGGTHPGAGVPAVLCSAKILDEVVPAPHAVRARQGG
jgi:phytoene desaturase